MSEQIGGEYLIYVPGHFRCTECGFQLFKQTLSAQTGNIGITENNLATEPCPNDGTMMVKVTWKEACEGASERLTEVFNERDAARESAQQMAVEAAAATREDVAAFLDHSTIPSWAKIIRERPLPAPQQKWLEEHDAALLSKHITCDQHNNIITSNYAVFQRQLAETRLDEAKWWMSRRGASDECLERIAQLEAASLGEGTDG